MKTFSLLLIIAASLLNTTANGAIVLSVKTIENNELQVVISGSITNSGDLPLNRSAFFLDSVSGANFVLEDGTSNITGTGQMGSKPFTGGRTFDNFGTIGDTIPLIFNPIWS